MSPSRNSKGEGLDSGQRAGRYVAGRWGYETFLPRPLPPDPPLVMGDGLLQILSRADIALGRLDGASALLPNPDYFVSMYVRKEAVSSSQIEGTQASLIDLLHFEGARVERGRHGDVHEIVNYVAALDHARRQLERGRRISISLLQETHGFLLRTGRGADHTPGELRTAQNWIGANGTSAQDAEFVPPDPDQMRQALQDLEAFIQHPPTLPPLLVAGLIHSQFETIHPFADGNGRMGRLLVTLYLLEANVLRRPLLYLSLHLRRQRERYFTALQAVRDSGDWEGWLGFFLEGVESVADDATAKAHAIIELREAHREAVQQRLGRRAASVLGVLELLYQRPYATVRGLALDGGRGYGLTNASVKALVNLGLIEEITSGRRNRIFAYRSYVELVQG